MKRIKYKTKAINYSKRKSKLAQKILDFFRERKDEDFESFGQLLDKYATIGMSKTSVCKVLQKIVEDAFVIKETTLDEAIKAEIVQKRTKFYYNARTTNNPLHGNRGIKRKSPQRRTIRTVRFKCVCAHSFSERILIGKKGFINLVNRRCPNCLNTNILSAIFIDSEKTVYKILPEQFVTKVIYKKYIKNIKRKDC